MTDFLDHYKAYLGIDDSIDQTMLSCPIRSEIFCFIRKQPLIHSILNGKGFYSLAPEYFEELKHSIKNFDSDLGFDKLLPKIDDAFCDLAEEYWIQKMFRMTVSESSIKKPAKLDLVEVFSEKHKTLYLKQFSSRGEKYKEKKWAFMQQLRDEGRYFIIIAEGKIASYSYISDIQAGGANIVVSTKPEFIKMGFGKAVVYAAANWCFQNNLIPICLVSQANLASVNLAKSLGFETRAEEIVVTLLK